MPSHTRNIDGIEALNVPLLTQPNRENECLLYAVSMVLKYCSEVHPSQNIRDNSEYLSPEDMKDEHIRVRDSGWAPDQADLDSLSEHTGTINLELKYWSRSPPLDMFETKVVEGLDADIPTIAIVDAKLIQGLDTENGQHAVVLTGYSDTHVVVADPWGEAARKLKKEVVIDAWDTKLNRMITVDTSRQTAVDKTLPEATQT